MRYLKALILSYTHGCYGMIWVHGCGLLKICWSGMMGHLLQVVTEESAFRHRLGGLQMEIPLRIWVQLFRETFY
jgi:hypothetical protein